MEFKNINEIPPDIFIKSVFAATHQAYSWDRKKIKHTKSIKLVLKVAEEIGYNKIGHGFYKYGHFSFRVFELMNLSFTYQSLHGLKKSKEVNSELIEVLIPIILNLTTKFLSGFGSFMKGAHTYDVPNEYIPLYTYGDKLERALLKLPQKRKMELAIANKKIGAIITEFDKCLNHVSKEKIDLYFKFTELLEGILIVCKYQDFNASISKKLINDLVDLYKDNISYLLYPFLDTLKNDDIDYEREKYNVATQNKIDYSAKRLPEIEKAIIDYGFKPRIEDLDKEIEIELNNMNKNKKKDLINLLTLSE